MRLVKCNDNRKRPLVKEFVNRCWLSATMDKFRRIAMNVCSCKLCVNINTAFQNVLLFGHSILLACRYLLVYLSLLEISSLAASSIKRLGSVMLHPAYIRVLKASQNINTGKGVQILLSNSSSMIKNFYQNHSGMSYKMLYIRPPTSSPLTRYSAGLFEEPTQYLRVKLDSCHRQHIW